MAARRIGCGWAGLAKFCGILNLPPPVRQSAYARHQKAQLEAVETVATADMKQSAQELADVTGSREVAVTFDGTWMRRGFSSLLGVSACIGFCTSCVLDLYVGSKHCQQCTIWSDKLEKSEISQDKFDEWKSQHSCKINTTKSSAAMEMEGACAIWKRSEEMRSLKYTTYISDGDSKSYLVVCAEDPYPDCEGVCGARTEETWHQAARAETHDEGQDTERRKGTVRKGPVD